MLSSYDQVKQLLLSRGGGYFSHDGLPLHVAASLVSGLVATVASTPFDFAKSRIMNYTASAASVGTTGTTGTTQLLPHARYTGMVDCLVRSVRAEGVRVLWSGFWATYIRLGPNITITFVVMEQLKGRFELPLA